MAAMLLRNASVIDGTGTPGFGGDVLVVDRRIASVGVTVERPSDCRVVDLDGLTLAPGFIDPHTHYDAQALWDRDLTPSCWHGVTSVVMGNCGYSVAPTRPEGQATIVRMLEAVEGMSRTALEAGIDWSFQSFPEYLGRVERSGSRLNIGAMVGHSALRYYVMGDDATERAATTEEISEMSSIVRAAVAAGALGFSSSRAAVDNGAYGKPVPSRLAEIAELDAIVGALGELGAGTVQILADARSDSGSAEFLGAFAKRCGRPVTFGSILTGIRGPRGAGRAMADQCERYGEGLVVPQIACRPIVQQITLADPFLLPLFASAFTDALAADPSERHRVYAEPDWRARAIAGLPDGQFAARLPGVVLDESEVNRESIGMTLDEIAHARGCQPLEALLDLSLEEGLSARFRVTLANDDEVEVTELLNDPRCLLSLSDAGAHQSQLCDAVYTTHLLGYWVRERRALPLELAIWRLTSHPAAVFGISDRGRIQPGMAADLVAFDPDTVAPSDRERVYDLPGHADRLVARSRGIEHVWVNGAEIVRNGEDVPNATPGMILRPSILQHRS